MGDERLQSEKKEGVCMPTNMTLSACLCVFLSNSNDMI